MDDNLKEQFKVSKKVETSEGEVSIVRVSPKKHKTSVPVIFAPGWLSNAEIFKNNIIALAEEGREVISFNDLYIKGVENEADVEAHKVKAILKILEDDNIDKVDIVAHSEGGLYGTTAASLHPERFRNIVLIDTAGITKKKSVRRLITGFISDILSSIVVGAQSKERRLAVATAFQEAIKSFKSNPKQAIKEVLKISKTDLSVTLKNLKDKGIGIALIHGVDDKLFSYKEVQEAIGEENVHIYNPVIGGHNAIYLEAQKYTKIIESILQELEERKF